MKRKLLSIVLAILSCFVFAFGFSACDVEDDGNSTVVTSVSLNSKSLELEVGESQTLVATVKLTVGGVEMTVIAGALDTAIDITVDWTSTDKTIVSVDKGKLTALKEGVAVIIATVGDKGAACIVSVNPAQSNPEPEPPVEETSGFVMPEGGYDGSKVEITFATTTGAALTEIIEDAIKDFNVLYPNITVKVDNSTKNYDDLYISITNKIIDGKQPHVALSYSDHVVGYNMANAVLTLDDFMPDGEYKDMTVTNTAGKEALGLTRAQTDDYVPAFFAEGSYYGDGKTYTLPFAKTTEAMYYNKTVFDRLGLTPPKTWAEMEEVCKTLTEYDEDCIALGYDSDANLFITLCEQYGSGYTSATDNHFLFDNEKNREFVAELKDWYDARYLTTREIEEMYMSNLLMNGKCYMAICSTAGSSLLDGTGIEVAPIPQVNPENPKTILQGPSVCIFMQENPQEVLASWLFVKYLTTNANFQGRYSQVSGYMPVLRSVYSSPAYQQFLNGTSMPARTARLGMENFDSYYTSPVFLGSAKAREEVGKIISIALRSDKSRIGEIFENAIEACNYFIS